MVSNNVLEGRVVSNHLRLVSLEKGSLSPAVVARGVLQRKVIIVLFYSFGYMNRFRRTGCPPLSVFNVARPKITTVCSRELILITAKDETLSYDCRHGHRKSIFKTELHRDNVCGCQSTSSPLCDLGDTTKFGNGWAMTIKKGTGSVTERKTPSSPRLPGVISIHTSPGGVANPMTRSTQAKIQTWMVTRPVGEAPLCPSEYDGTKQSGCYV